MKKLLFIGGNGALGVYLTEEALKAGYKVDVLCLENDKSDNENLSFIQHDGKDYEFLSELMKNKYDAIVDFMIYQSVEEYSPFADLYMKNTDHYLFLSSYRVYADECPLTEKSPRLLDVEKPDDFVCKNEYSIYKAEEENYIRSTEYKNWTILRPSITYSKRRFQLTILEANVFVWRMKKGKTVVLPEGAMNVEGTLSWAGDFGKAVIRLIFNEKAYCEAFTISTSEHHKWKEIADIYSEIGGLKYVTVDNETFINELYDGWCHAKQQLIYDRCVNRVIDNSKLLNATGLSQEDYIKLRDGLKMELSAYDGNDCNADMNAKMDALLKKMGIEN